MHVIIKNCNVCGWPIGTLTESNFIFLPKLLCGMALHRHFYYMMYHIMILLVRVLSRSVEENAVELMDSIRQTSILSLKEKLC